MKKLALTTALLLILTILAFAVVRHYCDICDKRTSPVNMFTGTLKCPISYGDFGSTSVEICMTCFDTIFGSTGTITINREAK